MKRFSGSVLTPALLVLLGSATESRGYDPCCAPPCPPQVVWVEKPVSCQRLEWKTREVEVEVMKPVYREEVRTVQRDVVVPEWREETREVTTFALKPRQVERQVCRYVPVACMAVDPCTGCCHTTYRPVPVMEKVVCTVHDCVPVKQQVKVQVCHYRTEKRDFKETLIHCDWQKSKVKQMQCYCVPVTYTTTVKVPVYVPCCP